MTVNRLSTTLLTIVFVAVSCVAFADATDVNGDGAANALDVQLVINAALGLAVEHDCDINDDGAHNALDVQLVINAALGMGPPEPKIEPGSGMPGSMVTVTGDGFNTADTNNNAVFFGAVEMPVVGASQTVLTTAVPITSAGAVDVRVEVNGIIVVDGLTFEILDLPDLTEPAGAVAATAQNNIASVAATVGTFLDPMIQTMDQEDAETMGEVFQMLDAQIEAIGELRDDATEDEKRVVDQVLLSSGLAGALGDIHTELAKRKAELDKLDPALAANYGSARGAKATFPARYRFTLDWLAARLHHGMEYANVAVMGLNAAAAIAPTTLGTGVGMLDLFAAFLNGVYTIIEITPMQLVKDSMIGRVGEGNTIATESYGEVVFGGDFEPETSLAKAAYGLFFPKFGEKLGLPSILTAILQSLASGLVTDLENSVDLPTIPPETGVPIYTYDFVGDPPTAPNPPQFDAGSIAMLAVEESIIYTFEIEGADEAGPFLLDADQKVYEFKGSFWSPSDQPRVETRVESYTIPVRVKKGLRVTITEPSPGTSIDEPPVKVTGTVRKHDGSPVDDSEITLTVRSAGGSRVVQTENGGDFDVDIDDVGTGETSITVIVTDGDTTATAGVVVFNKALPDTYCVVTNVSGDSLSLIDPATNEEFHRIESVDVGNSLDGPRDAAFLPDGDTLIVLNNPSGYPVHLAVLSLADLESIEAVGTTLTLGDGTSWSFDLAPDNATLLVPRRDDTVGINEVHTVDVRSPTALRVADTVSLAQFDDYGPVDIATGVANDGRQVALVTTGFYQDGGPGTVVAMDISNPYDVQVLGSVQVASGGGLIAAVPGQPLAVVAGTSFFGAQVDSAVDIIDFSDPDNVTVRDTLLLPVRFSFGLAVTPDGGMALLADAGQPSGYSNTMLFLDISNPDDVVEAAGISPIPFPGTGCPRIAVSRDGSSAVVSSNIGDIAFVFDLSVPETPSVTDPILVGDYPYGVVFNPGE